eukprot:75674-Prymnesium_polylepis.2
MPNDSVPYSARCVLGSIRPDTAHLRKKNWISHALCSRGSFCTRPARLADMFSAILNSDWVRALLPVAGECAWPCSAGILYAGICVSRRALQSDADSQQLAAVSMQPLDTNRHAARHGAPSGQAGAYPLAAS